MTLKFRSYFKWAEFCHMGALVQARAEAEAERLLTSDDVCCLRVFTGAASYPTKFGDDSRHGDIGP